MAERIFVAEIKVGGRRLRGVATENNAFDNLVGIVFHLHAIDESARLALVGIDAQVTGPGRSLGRNDHFSPVGKPAPPRPRSPEVRTALSTSSGLISLSAFRRARYPPPAS